VYDPEKSGQATKGVDGLALDRIKILLTIRVYKPGRF